MPNSLYGLQIMKLNTNITVLIPITCMSTPWTLKIIGKLVYFYYTHIR